MADVIVALDVADARSALEAVDRLTGLRWAKVGSVLMTGAGPDLVRQLVARDIAVFLDLKWYDIPSTVAGAVAAARGLGVRLATLHCVGGAAMLEAAVAAAGDELSLVGVTVLTSHTAASYAAAVGLAGTAPEKEVVRLARVAAAAGLAGVVCSPAEIGAVRPVVGSQGLIVVPGIRQPGEALGDQARVASSAAAVAAGATHLVVGRPVLGASDPDAVFRGLEAACAAF